MKSKKRIIGIAVCVCLLIAALCLLMPIRRNETVTLPAVVFRNGDLEHTTLTIDGTWTHTLAAPSHQSFAGKIQVDMLEYTHKEDTWDLDFQVTDDASDSHLTGGLFYNSGSGFDGYGWLYTDRAHDGYVLVTNRFDAQDDYIVIAPAETEEAAEQICDALGFTID